MSKFPDFVHQSYGVFANAADHFLSSFRSLGHKIKLCERGDIALGSRKKLCLFSHYDVEGKVDDHVVFYLQQLERCGVEIIFTSTAPSLDPEHKERIKKHCALVILRTNTGLDFGSWKVGLRQVLSVLGPDISRPDVSRYDQIILSNDSVYGPLVSLETIFDQMASRDVDVWGMTESQETGVYHLQSYFLVFQREAIRRRFLVRFLKNVRLLRRKWGIILNYEMGLSRKAISEGLRLGCYCSLTAFGRSLGSDLEKDRGKGFGKDIGEDFGKDLGELSGKIPGKDPRKLNPTHFFWKELLSEAKSPFVKVDLLRSNPQQIQDVESWQKYLPPDTSYPVELIENHLRRIRPYYGKPIG